MISYILLIIGFLFNGGTFGANLISGFEWVRIMYYGVAIFLVALYLFIFFMSYVVSKKSLPIKKRISFIGIVGGSATYVFTIITVWIVLINTIINTINPEATNWSDLSSAVKFLIILWFILTICFWLKSKLTKNKKNSKKSKVD